MPIEAIIFLIGLLLLAIVGFYLLIGRRKWANPDLTPSSSGTSAVAAPPANPAGGAKKEKVYVWKYGLTYLLYVIMLLFFLSLLLSFVAPILALVCYSATGGSHQSNDQSNQTQVQSSEKIITVTEEKSEAIPVRNNSLCFDIIEPANGKIWFIDQNNNIMSYQLGEKGKYRDRAGWLKIWSKQGEVKVRIWYE